MKLHIVITGAKRGIGLELVRQSLKAGNQVTAIARSPEQSPELVALKEKYPQQVKHLSVDVGDDTQVAQLRDRLSNETVDVLINNAGIYGEATPFQKLTTKEVLEVFNTNTLGPIRVTQALLPALQRSAHPKLVHVTSLMGSISDNTSGGSYAYRISKAALNMFNQSFTRDFPKIATLLVHPGWVRTEMGGASAPTLPEESARGILEQIKKLSLVNSGQFLDYEGEEISW